MLVVIQNTTFGGIQGFSRKPSTEWTMDDGSFAGIVHQERNWTYVLVYGAGHRVSESNPAAVRSAFSITPTVANASLQAFILAREFIFGSNQTGLVTSTSSVAIGGENANLTGASHDIVVAAPQIVVGTGATTATVIAPSATIAAWDGFLATRIPSSSGTSSSASASSTAKSKNAATRAHLPQLWLVITQLVWLLLL
jgi:carboxypeptidase D